MELTHLSRNHSFFCIAIYNGMNYHFGGENIGMVEVGIIMAGLGLLLGGIGIVWGVSIWSKQKEKK